MNVKWALGPIDNNQDIAAFNAEMGRRDAQAVFHPLSLPTAPETAVYTTAGTFCEPTSGGNGVIILATHGAGYDR